VNNADTYRPNSNLLFAGIGVTMCGLFIWSSFYQGGAASVAINICVASAILACIYTFLIRPKVTFYDEGVVITNLWKRSRSDGEKSLTSTPAGHSPLPLPTSP
jgi:uncharacterized membrane protein YobD (UPF0266 family)